MVIGWLHRSQFFCPSTQAFQAALQLWELAQEQAWAPLALPMGHPRHFLLLEERPQSHPLHSCHHSNPTHRLSPSLPVCRSESSPRRRSLPPPQLLYPCWRHHRSPSYLRLHPRPGPSYPPPPPSRAHARRWDTISCTHDCLLSV